MSVIEGLTPMVVVGVAFVAIVVFVKRLADREAAAERAGDEDEKRADTRAGAPSKPGPRVHMVPVHDDSDVPATDGENPPER
jgi:hypothetical protein